MPTTLLTGLPRSGTTLLCALLNGLPDTVALAEPIDGWAASIEQRLVQIDEFIVETRARALSEKIAQSMSISGAIPDNLTIEPADSSALRRWSAFNEPIKIAKPLSRDFRLYIKHPAAFVASIEAIYERYPVFAMVRHPLAVLASWQTVDIPLYKGRSAVAEAVDPELRLALTKAEGRLQRQLILLSWYLRRISVLNQRNVIRYEDLVSDPVSVLSRIHPAVDRISCAIWVKRVEERYPTVDLTLLARLAIPLSSFAERFYPGFQSSLMPYISGGV